jgi:hypothetical protein
LNNAAKHASDGKNEKSDMMREMKKFVAENFTKKFDPAGAGTDESRKKNRKVQAWI